MSRFSEPQLRGSIPFLASFASKRASGSSPNPFFSGGIRAPGAPEHLLAAGVYLCRELVFQTPERLRPSASGAAIHLNRLPGEGTLTQVVAALMAPADLWWPSSAGVIMGVPLCFISSFTRMFSSQLLQLEVVKLK